ncbi:MAG: zinc ABC transporter substrate-binding protein [Clostridia bacterium]|nr:zinc ABC transporter substrate-binding protein [Clostridia bacterium]
MKKTICFGILLAVLLSFCGCGSLHQEPAASDDGLYILTTIFPPYDFAREITDGVDNVTVQQLLRPGMESHTYDPTPADLIAVQNCDLFICTGGVSDAWVQTLLEAVPGAEQKCIRMIDLVDAVEEEHIEGSTHRHEHDHDHEDDGEDVHDHERTPDSDHIEYDEHVWSDPHNAMQITEVLCDRICLLDHVNEARYRENTEEYLQALSDLDGELHRIADHAVYRTLVFGDRFPMRYLCDAYGLGYRAAFPGCAAESEPSAATMIFLIEKVKEEGIPAILTIEMSNRKIAQTISEETGAPILMMHSCHNRTADEAAADKTYLDLMYENARVLSIALGQRNE